MDSWVTGKFRRADPTRSTNESPTPAPAEIETAMLHTSLGTIRLWLFAEYTPRTVANFVGLAAGTKTHTQPNAHGALSGPFYDGSLFHRVINGAWIQGGDPTGTGNGGPGYRFGDEFHPDLRFDRPYMLAMANAGPDTNGSQFFITQVRQPHLDFRNTIFGTVADPSSQLVVDRIAAVPTGPRDRPLDDVFLNRVELQADAAPPRP